MERGQGRPLIIFIPDRGSESLKRRLRKSCLKSRAVAFNAIGAHLKIPSKMYSEISACPCLPLARITNRPPLPLLLRRPSLKPPPEAISAALSLLPYYPPSSWSSPLPVPLSYTTHTHTYTNAHIFSLFRFFSVFLSFSFLLRGLLLSLVSVIVSFPRASDERSLKSSKERQSQGLSDWIVSSIYTTFGSPSFSLSPFLHWTRTDTVHLRTNFANRNVLGS